ncbi:MAG: prolyl oligopeptidase family serine peptidase, partial [Gemmataceae bacterium]
SAATSAKMSLYEFDVATAKTRELLTPEMLLKGAEEKLTPQEKARRERQRVTVGGFTTYHLSPDGTRILLSLSGRLYVIDRATLAVKELPTGKGTLVDPKFGPAGASVFYVLDHDVYRVDLAAMKESRVTAGGTEKKPHGLAEFVAQEEMARFTGYWPSPDGKHVAYQESDHDGVEVWYVADPIHPDRAGHPSYYPRPGKKNVAVRLGVIPVEGGATVWVEWDREKYPYLGRVDWQEGGLTLLVQDRAQQEQMLLKADPATGKTAALLTEKDAAWLNLNHDKPHWQEDGSFLWHGHGKAGAELRLWWPDGKSRLVVSAKEGFRSLLHDRDGDLYYVASLDPSQAYVHRVGGRPRLRVALTPEPGLHTAEVGKRGAYVITSSTLGAMPKSVVHAPDGKAVGELPSAAQEPPLKVSQTIEKVGDFWTTVIRPTKFDAKKKYPVIVHVYGGPGHQEVLAQMGRRLIDQWIADQGFILVGIDGRGTPHRGRDWERATYKKFGTMALDDQVAGLKALLAKHPEMDGDRVGVYGWSFGGYMSAMAALREPKVFKAAVAGAPVTEWLDYDTHYTERFMGVPGEDDPDYKRESLLTMAKGRGPVAPLLLVHGTADDNVYFRHTLRLADALFREGKEFDVLPLSGLTHLVPDPVVTRRLYGRFVGFFHKHLGKPEAVK